MNIRSTARRSRVIVAGLLTMIFVLTACGGAGTADTDDSGGADAASSNVPSVDELTATGTESDPPTEGPAPAKGKSVWWVSCGMVVPDCSVPAESAAEAAKYLGMDFRIADGRLNAEGGNVTAINTALAASPDAIIVHGIACDTIKAPLQDAKKRGIPVMGVETLDCDVDDPGNEANNLFTADMQYADDAITSEDYFATWGRQLAYYLIAKTGGEAKLLNLAGQSNPNIFIGTAFLEAIDQECGGCDIVENIEYLQSEQVPNGPMIQRFRTALVRHPEATAVNFESGANAGGLGGAQEAYQTNPALITVSGTGLAPELDLVRDGKLTAVIAHSSEWMGYAAMDNINRQLQGEDAVPQGLGFRAVDAEHNLPDEGMTYQTPIDFVSAYKKLWGVS